MKLPENVLDVLAHHIAIDPDKHTVRLTRRFDDEMDLYKQVTRVLADLGGSYRSSGKRSGVHVFEDDPSDLIGAVLETGEVNPLALFPTPKDVAHQIALGETLITDYDNANRVALEPSAGQGVFIEAMLAAGWSGTIVAVELDPTNVKLLRRRFGANPRVIIVEGAFEDYDGQDGPFHVVLMNPPFSVGGKSTTLYIDHIRRALGMLHHAGRLHAIAPVSWRFRQDRASEEFADLMTRWGDYELLPPGTFREAGTAVDTCVITLEPLSPRMYDGDDDYPTPAMKLLDIYISQDTSFRGRRNAIWKQIDAGELERDMFGDPLPKTREAILNLFRDRIQHFRSAHDWFIRLRPEEEAWVLESFLRRYDFACSQDWYSQEFIEHAAPVVVQSRPSSAPRHIPEVELPWYDAATVISWLERTLAAAQIRATVTSSDARTVCVELADGEGEMSVRLPSREKAVGVWIVRLGEIKEIVTFHDQICQSVVTVVMRHRIAGIQAAIPPRPRLQSRAA